jgi:uracil phosphoribosyltransferase
MKEHYLTILRNKATSIPEFRHAANELTDLLAASLVSHLALTPHAVQTPLKTTHGATFSEQAVLVPILRSGLSMLPPFLHLFPSALIGVLGIRRDETTFKPHLYYKKLPALTPQTRIFLLDPMLATGGTAILAIQTLLDAGASAKQIALISLIGSKPGVQALKDHHPQVTLHIAAVDPELNKQAYIVPGLGDFGDRFFGT